MKHDELCPLSQPCDPEEPSHGYCGFSAPLFCIDCHTWCTCAELGKKREQAIRDCIDDLEARIEREKDERDGDGLLDGLEYAADCLRALLEGESNGA